MKDAYFSLRKKYGITSSSSPLAFTIKSLGFALATPYIVKYGSLLVNLPQHVDLELASIVALLVCLFVVWDVSKTIGQKEFGV